jgi:hypothetical protein
MNPILKTLTILVVLVSSFLSSCESQSSGISQTNITADFNAVRTSGKAPFEARFTNDSIGSGIIWEWNFGDGSKSNEQNPSHIYAKDGSYDVSLKVSSKNDSQSYRQMDYIIVGADFTQVEAEDIVLKWKTDNEKVHFILTAPTTGWVALGIDPDPEGKMAGADFILGCVAEGVVTIRDDYGTDMYMHQPDTDAGGTDTILNKGGKENGGSTMITFELPLNNTEKTDKYLELGKTYTVILAYGASDDMNQKHVVRTYSKITL